MTLFAWHWASALDFSPTPPALCCHPHLILWKNQHTYYISTYIQLHVGAISNGLKLGFTVSDLQLQYTPAGVNILSRDPFVPSFPQKVIISKSVQKQKSSAGCMSWIFFSCLMIHGVGVWISLGLCWFNGSIYLTVCVWGWKLKCTFLLLLLRLRDVVDPFFFSGEFLSIKRRFFVPSSFGRVCCHAAEMLLLPSRRKKFWQDFFPLLFLSEEQANHQSYSRYNNRKMGHFALAAFFLFVNHPFNLIKYVWQLFFTLVAKGSLSCHPLPHHKKIGLSGVYSSGKTSPFALMTM